MPPALSATGPYESTATTMPVVASMPNAAIAMPYIPARWWAKMIETPSTSTGMAVLSIPTAVPVVTVIAGPIWDDSASRLTGLYFVDVKYSLTSPMITPLAIPASVA